MVLLVFPTPAGAIEWCMPDTAKEAYDAILAGAPDGSELESEAKELAADRKAEGEFDTEETLDDLDDLAFDHDYLFDCDARIYRYAPDEAPSDDYVDDDDDETATTSPPTTARPTSPTVPTTARPAPRPPVTQAPLSANHTAAPPAAVSSATSGQSSASAYSYYSRWATPPAPAKSVPSTTTTLFSSPPLVKSLASPPAAVSSARSKTSLGQRRADKRIFLIPAALGIALGVEVISRWARRYRRI